MDSSENSPLKDLAARTSQIVSWLGLNNVPAAAQVDSTGKLGLQGAFRMHESLYFDPIPASVIQKAKEDVAASKENKTIDIPLLEAGQMGGKVYRSAEPRITVGGTIVPIFKEQVQSVAQFLTRLDFEPPQQRGTKGENFVIVDNNPYNTQSYKTKDPNIGVRVTRNGPNDTDQATRVELVIWKR